MKMDPMDAVMRVEEYDVSWKGIFLYGFIRPIFFYSLS
jgi:hypothetical protein